MKNINKALVFLFLTVMTSGGTVLLQFNTPFSTTGGVASGFADSSGAISNGLIWGIIIDSDNSGFFTTYDAFTPSANSVTILGSGGVATTNVLVTSTNLTSSLAGQNEFSSTFSPENPGGDGGLSAVAEVDVDGTNGVTAGDVFRLVWFDPSGSSAGFIDNASFTLPSDASSTDYSGVFRGPDTARPATGITIIPEPSALLLSAFGLLTVLRRKR